MKSPRCNRLYILLRLQKHDWTRFEAWMGPFPWKVRKVWCARCGKERRPPRLLRV